MPKKENPARALEADLKARLAACKDAEEMNDRVILPFVAALEAVCGERGYVLNIYGDTANLVFTGDPDAAEEIFQIVEAYLDDEE